jgi:hypothetical protein
MQGECNCGAIAFELDSEPAGIFVCHCSICRRATGVHGVAVVVIGNEHFRWLRGEDMIASWKKPGVDWQTWFCRQCGSMVPGHNDEARMFVPAGLLGAGAESLVVRHHIWVDSKADWDIIGDSGKQHREAFEG